jgi:nitroreductase
MDGGERQEAFWARYRQDGIWPPGPWNPAIAGLMAHRSVRAYLPDALEPGTLETLVAAAQSAASSSNLQLWDVVAVEDPARKDRLSMLAGDQAQIREAPLFLVWIANFARAEAMAQAAGRELDAVHYLEMLMVAIVDASLAAQNATVAAESLGLGAVYIGAVRNHIDQVAAELELPRRAFALFGMVVGRADPARPTDVKPRLPQAVVLHREKFQPDANLDLISDYDKKIMEFQHEQAMAEIGWTRTVLSRLRNAGSLHGREHAKEILSGLGFQIR